MREFDAELKDLRERIARLRRNTVRLETLRGQEAEALADAERLHRVWSAEQKDVEDLGCLLYTSSAPGPTCKRPVHKMFSKKRELFPICC